MFLDQEGSGEQRDSMNVGSLGNGFTNIATMLTAEALIAAGRAAIKRGIRISLKKLKHLFGAC